MQTTVLIIHTVIALGIIILVLMQRGKGAEAGAAFGAGASGTVFGARGSSSFFSRATAILATAFFATSLSLAWISSQTASTTDSLIEDMPAAPQAAPACRNCPERRRRHRNSRTYRRSKEKLPKKRRRRRSRRRKTQHCRRGGIGRHAVLRGQWRKLCRFESGRRHQVRKGEPAGLPLFTWHLWPNFAAVPLRRMPTRHESDRRPRRGRPGRGLAARGPDKGVLRLQKSRLPGLEGVLTVQGTLIQWRADLGPKSRTTADLPEC